VELCEVLETMKAIQATNLDRSRIKVYLHWVFYMYGIKSVHRQISKATNTICSLYYRVLDYTTLYCTRLYSIECIHSVILVNMKNNTDYGQVQTVYYIALAPFYESKI
jgi:hypothetical protein